MNLARLARTAAHLHPLQVIARPAHATLRAFVHDVTGARAPLGRETWPPVPDALRALARSERRRASERLARLAPSSRLRAYEEAYGFELGDDGATAAAGAWTSRAAAIEPYPSSVRARRIAIAMRCGARGLEGELARAARAVILRPEIHLLGNHLLENGFGLACAGAAARGVEADVWWSAGAAILDWQLGAQFLADGGHVERSASYQAALLGALLETIELARAAGRRPPDAWKPIAARALCWALAARTPDGTIPLFNDASIDAAPSVEHLAALASAIGIAPEAVARTERFGDVSTTTLHPTGWLRVDAADATLWLDAAPDADGWQPGHAHADGLTFELWVRGERVVVDYGVASYEDDAARRETRATRSHNTVEVDGHDSCEVWGAFRVGRRASGRVMAASVGPNGASFDLEHDGYAWMPGSPRHQRRIEMNAGSLHVRDRVSGGRASWTSRLRLDEQATAGVSVGGAERFSQAPGPWFARHGDPRAAVVLQQRGGSGEVVWSLRWSNDTRSAVASIAWSAP